MRPETDSDGLKERMESLALAVSLPPCLGRAREQCWKITMCVRL